MRNILIIITLISSIYSANNLASEPSPYLQQHKENPVNWYPWGKEAFEKAKKEKKLIFLSIGYSTCHWCHVMAKESFSDKEVAQLLNRDYIAIKVDKEQYPQIDEYYQGIYQIFNRRGGGWPLTVIMTPNKKPIFAATYIPKYTRGEFKGLMDILPFFTKLDKKELESEGKRVLKIYSNYLNSSKSKAKISKNILTSALSGYKASYDTLYKGFGGAPKFPQASKLNNLLTIYELSGSKSSLEMVTQALDAMAKSGLYDQIEGGFFRYSVDRKWSIPHFEKMLYTNAQLIEVYTKAYNLTGKKLYKKVVKKSISNINKYFKIDSLYKSASNADSKNFDNKEEEGFYFIYDYNKAFDYISKKGVDKKSVKQNLHYLSIDDSDNFNGVSSHAQINSLIKPDNNLPKVVNALREIREKKEYPFIDYKINTAWNALYINALIKAGAIDRQYSQEGIKSLNALVKKMYRNGVLYHQSVPSKIATQKAFLEDYAFVADALFSAYQVTLNKKYFKLYKTILLDAKDRFYKNSQWYISQDKFKIVASLDDRSYKSSLAILLKNLYILSVIDADIKLQSLVKKTLHSYGDIINNSAAHMPSALDLALMIQRDVIIFKANKESLQNEKLDINYPFLYKYSIDKNDIYLACNKSSCFSFSKNIKRVKEDILLKIKLKPNKH